jgi:DNA-binding winged helix-turn-helix (wHTH) protein
MLGEEPEDQLLRPAALLELPDMRIGAADLSPRSRVLSGPDGRIALNPRTLQLLVVLADASGEVVTRRTIERRCWGVAVNEDVLNQAVASLRRAARAAGGLRIETIPRTGYRLVAEAEALAPAPRLAQAATAARTAWRMGIPAPDTDAIAALEAALAQKPDWAEGWGLIALLLRKASEYAEAAECSPFVLRCEAAISHALAIDAAAPDALAARATLPPLFGDWLGTRMRLHDLEQQAGRTIVFLHDFALLEMATGRPSAAAPLIEEALAMDQLAPVLLYKRIYHLWTLGRLQDMDHVADRAMQLWPTHPAIWFARLWSLLGTGRPRAALAQVDDPARPDIPLPALSLLRSTLDVLANQPHLEALEGPRAEIIGRNLAASTRGPSQALSSMLLLAALGAVDAAFDVARGLYARQGPVVVGLRRNPETPSVTDQHRRVTQALFVPLMAPVREDSRFEALCNEMGLDRYWADGGIEPDFRRR